MHEILQEKYSRCNAELLENTLSKKHKQQLVAYDKCTNTCPNVLMGDNTSTVSKLLPYFV